LKKKIVIASVTVVVMLVVLGIYYYKLNNRNAVEVMVADGKIINILVAGSNKEKSAKFNFYSVISINPENKFIGITFIPPEYKIYQDQDGNIKTISDLKFSEFDRIKRTLKVDMKLNIPFYLKIDSKGLEKIVDLFDGVDQFVLDDASQINGTFYGVNYFDGKKTIEYINKVPFNSIYLKYGKIQNLIFTILNKREKYQKYFNIPFLLKVSKNFQSNLFVQEIISMVDIVKDGSDVFSTVLPGFFENGVYKLDEISQKDYEDKMLTRIVSDKKKDVTLKIKILNGTNIPGLARKIRKKMMRQDLNVIEFSTSPYEKRKKSIIVCRKADTEIAKKIKQRTGIKNIYYVINQELYNILVILGEDIKNYENK